jgi:hypothetical protein
MAKTKLPDPLGRRHLIERELAPAQAIKYAEAYLEAGRPLEAVDFFAKAEATEPLAKLRRDAVSAGDVFLLRVVATATGDFPGRDEWQEVARAADAAGKQRYAVEARRLAEVGEE